VVFTYVVSEAVYDYLFEDLERGKMSDIEMIIKYTQQGKKITHPSGVVNVYTVDDINKLIDQRKISLEHETKTINALHNDVAKIEAA